MLTGKASLLKLIIKILIKGKLAKFLSMKLYNICGNQVIAIEKYIYSLTK